MKTINDDDVVFDEVEDDNEVKMKEYEELEFTDDFMFCKVLENNPKLCKELAEMITGEKFGKIKEDVQQKSIRILPNGHGVRFDVYLTDGNTIVDIEMQNITKKNLPKRSRYYQSTIDISMFEKSKDYENLPRCYIIFLTMDNLFPEKNLWKYTFVNTCRENKDIELGDDAIKIFLTPDGNREGMSEEMEAFMTYVVDKKAESDFTRQLEEQEKIAMYMPNIA